MATQVNVGGDSANYVSDVGWEYTVVDLSDNSTTVASVPSIIGNVWVTVVLSAHVCPIKDNTTVIANLAASAAVGDALTAQFGTRTTTSLIVDPDDSATGTIIVQHRPV